ncbi:MAG TPA: iron uptake transporter deferrochelatase/peroxidase subunit [Chloroflexota bacterium]|jgi:deferrochelatase/peroxidase EfeB
MGSGTSHWNMRLGRRRFLGATAASGAALALGREGGAAAPAALAAGPAARYVVPFYGRHQAGVSTPAPAHLLFASYDLLPDATAADLQRLLQAWTAAAARLTQGQPGPGDAVPSPAGAPDDAAATAGVDPLGLTLTVGLGPGVFDPERGVADRRPRSLSPLPRFRNDALDPARSGGDLCVQACADDPTVVFHAEREMTRAAEGVAKPRWTQRGFGATTDARASGETPRNLQGFKDGTANPLPTDAEFDGIVWVQPEDEPAWLRDGSYLVVRRIRMDLDRWEATPTVQQERVIGRAKESGAPLSSGGEHDPVDLRATGSDGQLLVPENSHVHLTNPARNFDARMLRRGYSYDNGWDPTANGGSGQADAGLLFMAYVRDPAAQFIPMQQRLANADALNRFITHVGSALFAVLPGAPEGGYLGQTLFG